MDIKKKKKSVSFENKLEKVHRLITWEYASRKARSGICWLLASSDRRRFNNRIQYSEFVISPILETNHRNKIYKILYSNYKS